MIGATIIRVHGLGDGTGFAEPMWVEDYDLDAVPDRKESYLIPNGAVINGAFGGRIVLTTVRETAQRFTSAGVAFEAWRTPSRRVPVRPDGKPNRPLSVLTITAEPVETQS